MLREVLTLYQELKKTSPTKYASMVRRTSEDGRIRGLFSHHHASTGRWSSRGINFQNLTRPVISDANDYIDFFPLCEHEEPMKVLVSAIRGMIKARDGYRLLDADYSQIEARILAFIAGEWDIINAFINGVDVYTRQAELMNTERQLGKVAVLALGYGGADGAYISMAEVYGMEALSPMLVKKLVKQYRRSNPNIVRLWHQINEAALGAVRNRGTVYQVNDYISYRADQLRLQCRLPSGRVLNYWRPCVKEGKFGAPQVYFEGKNDKGMWVQQSAWHGLLTENVVQAIAADILRLALQRLEAEGYYTIMHVHDQVVAEMPIGVGSIDEMIAIMCRDIPWFKGFPIAADGKELDRFEK